MCDLGEELRALLQDRGAALVGFADLTPVDAAARLGLSRSVSIAVALDPTIVASIHDRPNEEYVAEYRRRNELLACLGEAARDHLREAGYQTESLPPTGSGVDDSTLSTRLPHKTSATRAGLGWIGKTALLVTREYGPAVRFATVLTDAPLSVGTPIERSRCGACDDCVRLCPPQAAGYGAWATNAPPSSMPLPAGPTAAPSRRAKASATASAAAVWRCARIP